MCMQYVPDKGELLLHTCHGNRNDNIVVGLITKVQNDRAVTMIVWVVQL